MTTSDSDSLLSAIEDGKIPQYFYRYRTISQTIEFLQNPMFYLNVYTEFNDPFECVAHIDMNFNQEDFDRWLSKAWHMPTPPPHIDISKNKERVHNMIAEGIKNANQKVGICCFSENPSSLLMWSHYADNHKGACLKYDPTIDPSAFLIPINVVYDDVYPSFNYIKNQDEAVKALCHKSKAWEYEKEWRIIAVDQAKTLRHIKPHALKEIIFGCRCSQEDIKKVESILKEQSLSGIKLKKCKEKEGSFGLDFVAL